MPNPTMSPVVDDGTSGQSNGSGHKVTEPSLLQPIGEMPGESEDGDGSRDDGTDDASGDGLPDPRGPTTELDGGTPDPGGSVAEPGAAPESQQV